MYNKLTTFAVLILLLGFVSLQAQTNISYEKLPNIAISGDENRAMSNIEVIQSNNPINFHLVNSGIFTWDVHNITDRATGYDLQSNSSCQQLWLDVNTGLMHAIFTNSQVAINPWADRTTLYFGSTNAGVDWFELGPVPNATRCGYPAIYGDATGSAIVMNHNAVFASTRTTVMPDNSPFEYNFGNFDPGVIPEGDPIWPRFIVAQNGDYIFASSRNISPPDSFYLNIFTPGTGTFRGYEPWDGNYAEVYTFGISPSGKIGLAYLGQANGASYVNDGDVFLSESTDNGQTWTTPLKIYERDHSVDTTWGAMRGITLNYYGEEACVLFETAWQDFAAGTYQQGNINEMYFWSANVNGGDPMVLIDNTWVHYNVGGGANDVYLGVSRPVLSRSVNADALFLAFSVSSGEVWPDTLTEQSPYFDGYFMMSIDGGENWTEAEKFTPDTPRLDWRYPSIAPIIPPNSPDDDVYTVHIVVQGDSLPGSTVQVTAPMVVGVTAQYYHFSAENVVIPVELISFSAKNKGNDVMLNWTTATEINNEGFEVQRRMQNGEFDRIGFVEGNGTTTEVQNYFFIDEKLIPGTYAYRLKQIDLDGTSELSNVIEVEVSTPFDYSLSQNYPNPFNPSTTINYSIRTDGYVSLKVYDVLGNEVLSLVDEQKQSGTFDVHFNASTLSSGVYYYTLKAGVFTSTKKLVLIK